MKLSHLLANDIRAEREIEIVSRRRRDDPSPTQTTGSARAFPTTTLIQRLLQPAR